MFVSCPSWSFGTQWVVGELDLAGALGIIRALGFRHCEIGFGHVQPVVIAQDPLLHAEDTRRLLDKNELVVHDVYPWWATRFSRAPLTWINCSINPREKEVRDEVLALFDGLVQYTKAIGAEGITVGSGPVHEDLEFEASFDLSRQMLTEMLKRAHDAGLELGIEPHLKATTHCPSTALRMCQEVPGLQVALDWTHFIRAGFSMEDGDVLIPYARRVDARQGNRELVQCRMRDGEVDYRHVVTKLFESGYRRAISCEYVCNEFAPGCDTLDCVTETLLMKKHLEQLIYEVLPVGVRR
jgi:sugar phosphate isomerase/epimerase